MNIKEISQVGKQVLELGQALIIGISIGNKYFKDENLRKLIKFGLDSRACKIYIMIPDEPMVATLMAFGKTEVQAQRVARLKANALENKCTAIAKELGADILIIRWKDVVTNSSYIQFLNDLRKYFYEDRVFRGDVRQVTAEVLLNNSGFANALNLEIGVQFLLKELAFILMSNRILGEETIAYVYHKTMSVLKSAVEHKYSLYNGSSVGYITAE